MVSAITCVCAFTQELSMEDKGNVHIPPLLHSLIEEPFSFRDYCQFSYTSDSLFERPQYVWKCQHALCFLTLKPQLFNVTCSYVVIVSRYNSISLTITETRTTRI